MILSSDTVEGFAIKRSRVLSFPYLKENGELLSIGYHSGLLVEARTLDLYSEFYDKSFSILQCYPQYYRFILGLILDLEGLGYDGNMGQKIRTFVTQENFISYDTSDCRRLEVLSLLSRQGNLDQNHKQWETKLYQNISSFVQNPKHFTKFSKPLFYDLTHIVFFLTDYGHKTTALKDYFVSALTYVGILALLDYDADLLAEVSICLKYLGVKPPAYWTDFLLYSLSSIEVSFNQSVKSHLNSAVDEYHLYLVLNWYAASEGQPTFTERFGSKTPNFTCPPRPKTPLAYLADITHNCVINVSKSEFTHSDFMSLLSESDQTHVTSTIESSPKSHSLLYETSNGSLKV